MNLPTDLRDFRPSQDEDSFQIISGDSAVMWLCCIAFLAFVFRGYV
jgi:hypothetical protein